MIAHLQRASNTAGLLTYLYGPGERGNHIDPRLISGDCHGAPIEMLAQADALPYLAHALNAPVERIGARAPAQPVWICSVRSDPRRADLTDGQWSDVARRVVASTGIAPDGDPDACRWIALRNGSRQVHVVATLAREDGSLPRTYRAAFDVQTECHRIATELGHLTPAPQPPAPRPQESLVPAITISNEPSGSVAAKGVPDDFSATLLKHAGFEEINDWHGRRHRLPTTTPQAARVAIASFAAQMLRAARYSVELDPALESSQQPTLSNPRGLHPVGDQVLGIADQIRGAETGADAARAVDQLLDPTNGVLIRLQEALEAATETTNDLSDHDAYELADKFTAASEHLTAACEELTDATAELFGLDGFAPESETSHHAHGTVRSATAVTSAARATSPAASKAAASLGASVPESSGAALPSRVPGPRTR